MSEREHAVGSDAEDAIARRYRRANAVVAAVILSIALGLSVTFGVVLRDWLDANFTLGGRPAGFWFVQQGVIYLNLIAALVYCLAAARLDAGRARRGSRST